MKKYLRAQLRDLTKRPIDDLVEARYQRFRNYGVFTTEALAAENAEASSESSASSAPDATLES